MDVSLGSGDVLSEEPPRTHLVEHPPHVRPQVSGVSDSFPLAGDGVRLAWVARRDEVHASTKRCAVEGCEIVPDRSAIQGLVFHPRHEDGRCVGFPLDVTHGSYPVSQGESKSEVKSSDPGTEAEGT